MKHLIARWRDRWRHRGSAPEGDAPVNGATAVDGRDDREIARSLAEAIERAIRLGLWEHAERIAAAASRLAREHAHLAEWLARLRLTSTQLPSSQTSPGRCDPETAISIIDSCKTCPASLRMLRSVCLLQLGRQAEAHMDLHRWARKSSAPLQARLILALLEWKSGDWAAANAALLHNLRQLEDSRTLTVLMLISAAEGRTELATSWSEQLCSAWAWNAASPDVDVLLRSMGMSGIDHVQSEPHPEHIKVLAIELLANEPVIGALVEAQCRRPRPAMAHLLRKAIETALPDLEDAASGYHALARISLAMDDRAAATVWMARGLAQYPLSANLARLSRDLAGDASIEVNQRPNPDVLATIGDVARQAEGAAQERAA